jgi:hypothetical protein
LNATLAITTLVPANATSGSEKWTGDAKQVRQIFFCLSHFAQQLSVCVCLFLFAVDQFLYLNDLFAGIFSDMHGPLPNLWLFLLAGRISQFGVFGREA